MTIEFGQINGLALPRPLVDSINAGRWNTPTRAVWNRAFSKAAVEDPHLLTANGIVLENRGWPKMASNLFLGTLDADADPGVVVPDRSIVIADLGQDLPIALDYRTPGAEPSVILWRVQGRAHYWTRIANDITGFMMMLGISI